MAGMGPAPYVDNDLMYGNMLGSLISPDGGMDSNEAQGRAAIGPQSEGTKGAVTSVAQPRSASAPAPQPDQRFAVPPNEPPNPTLKPRTPQPAPTAPAATSPTGTSSPPKTWADYVRGGLDQSMAAQKNAQAAATELQNQPSVTSQNQPLEARRSALAQPLNPQAKEYRPGIGTRIVRGVDAFRRGGVLGVVDPADAGGRAYGAPTHQYDIDSGRRQAQVASIDQEMKANEDTAKADSERLGKIGSEQRAVAVGAKDVAGAATAQQNAESTEGLKAAQAEAAEAKANANTAKVPKTYEETVAAAALEQDPARKKALTTASELMRQTELKKFQYAARATGGSGADDKRQALIDDATQKVDVLNHYEYDPELNDGRGGFYDTNEPKKQYTPEQFTGLKNKIARALDVQLTRAKLRPLGVKFDVAATTPGGVKPAASSVPTQAAPSGDDSKFAGQPTPQETSGKMVMTNPQTKQTIVYRGGKWRDVTSGKEVK